MIPWDCLLIILSYLKMMQRKSSFMSAVEWPKIKQTNKQTKRQTNKQTNTKTNIKTNKKTNKESNGKKQSKETKFSENE